MNYGLYLSATGVMTNTYRQDVIANNLANIETVGFKRNIASFQQRLTEAQQRCAPGLSEPMLEHIGGGLFCSPTMLDSSQGELERTGNNLDVAILGKGFFAVQDKDQATRLTRDGRFMLDEQGNLILSNASASRVLDAEGQPINLPGHVASAVEISPDGTISAHGQSIGKLGVFQVADESKLVKEGGGLLRGPGAKDLQAVDPTLRNGFVERSNVDPATELTTLMETQRQLEANANMIRYQDQTLGRCVNDVGKIG
jgi:flagellar basal body rod protein FlgG